MKLKAYFRGLGIGMIVTALVMSVAGKTRPLSDEQIRTRATELGMVDEGEKSLIESLGVDAENKETDDSKNINNEKQSDIKLATEDKKTDTGKLEDGNSKEKIVDDKNADDVKSDSTNKSANSDADERNTKGVMDGNDLDTNKSESKSSPSVKLPATGNKADESEDGQAPAKKNEKSSSDRNTVKASSSSVKKSTSSSANRTTSSSSFAKSSSSSATLKSTSTSSVKKSSSSSKSTSTSSVKKSSSSSKSTSTSSEKKTSSSSEKMLNVESTPETVTITIAGGSSSTSVAKSLQAAGLISSAEAFDKFLCDSGYDRKISTGKKVIPRDASNVEIAEILTVR